MIIDIHAHIGETGSGAKMPLENQLTAMQKYHIDYALVSNISCSEHTTKEQKGRDVQYELNADAIRQIRPHADKLGLMLWCRPNAELGYTESFEKLYLENKDIIKGIKFHPGASGLPFNDDKVIPYLQMAERYDLPVLIHTAEDGNSNVRFVCEMAEKFHKVKFILGHLSLGYDKTESYEAMEKYPNVYGDTAFVIFRFAQQVCQRGLVDKLMFGTDSPIGGVDTCGSEFYYKEYYGNDILSQEEMDKIMFKNAIRIFRLDQ